MKRFVFGLLIAVIVAFGAVTISSADTMSSGAPAAPVFVTPDQLKWTECQGIEGCSQAVVWGDPDNKTGAAWVIRLKLDDGVKVPVHWHTASERGTVLSGTLLFAAGHKIDPAKTTALPAGSFLFVPAMVHHYAIAKGATVLQISGNGQRTFNLMK